MNDIEQTNSESGNTTQLVLETAVIKEKKATDQSVTDLYGIHTFTSEFRNQIAEYETNRTDLIAGKQVFTNQIMSEQESLSVQNNLFQTSAVVSRDYNAKDTANTTEYYIFGAIIILLILFISVYGFILKRRK